MTNREQILRITSALFLERGCKSLTMDEVASANGMSKRTIYELFHDKAELLQECILLMHRDNMNKSEDELAKAGNVLEWFMHSLRSKDSQRMTFYYDFFTEVKKYYPEVFLNVVKDAGAEGGPVHYRSPGCPQPFPPALRALGGGDRQGGAQLFRNKARPRFRLPDALSYQGHSLGEGQGLYR